jgi:hypothetical protein
MNPKPDKLIPALYGGIIMAVISTVPFLSLINCLCCAGLLLGGFSAVYFYKNNFTPDTPPFTSSDCMSVGALAGVISAVIGTILSLMFLSLFGNVMGEFIMKILREYSSQIPEQTLDQIEGALERKMSVLFIFIGFFQSLILHTLFGLLGGLIGYSIFKPKQQQMMPPPPMPPPQFPV